MIVSVPVTLVPLVCFAAAGLKVTTTSQVPVVAAKVPRQFWAAEKPAPVTVILVMSIATALALVRPTDISRLVPAWVLGKASDFGVKVSLPRGTFFSAADEALEAARAVPNSNRLTTNDTIPASLLCRDFAPSGGYNFKSYPVDGKRRNQKRSRARSR